MPSHPACSGSFWHAKADNELKESFPLFVEKGVLDDQEGPQLLGILLSCASGYADLPAALSSTEEGIFRALLDCRVVLRTMRSLSAYLGHIDDNSIDAIRLEYGEGARDIQFIPKLSSPKALIAWAEKQEKRIYAELDAFAARDNNELPVSRRFESVLWLQSVRFVRNDIPIAPNRLLMLDDLHRLRHKQRNLLVDELTVQRPEMPIWLAMRTLVLGDDFLSQGARSERDIYDYALEELWGWPKGHQPVFPFRPECPRPTDESPGLGSRKFSRNA
ncbi:MAG: hypothetical protein M5U09_23715 [Gammaproteobacteria bacterium]|nr:hypothetical protein [Gammaproteobacteria bacterium]